MRINAEHCREFRLWRGLFSADRAVERVDHALNFDESGSCALRLVAVEWRGEHLGMGIALFVNTLVSYIIAAIFLPTVGAHGYATMFFVFAGCTVVYFITAAFFLPETKGKTLEEIEEYFEGRKKN